MKPGRIPNTWLAEDCVEPDEKEPEPRTITLKQTEQLWSSTRERWPTELIRMRHCRGCVFLSRAGSSLVCNYCICTGQRRPCQAGSPCSVKETAPGYQDTPKHLAWVRKLDKEEKERKKKKVKQRGRRGKKITWDVDYARKLYDLHYSPSEISQIIGVPKNTVASYACIHNWRSGTHVYPPRGRDLTAEKEAYEAYKRGDDQ